MAEISLQVAGLDSMQRYIENLRNAAASGEAKQVILSAEQLMLHELQTSASAVNLPRRAIRDLFISNPSTENNANVISGIVGMRKRGRGIPAYGYEEWIASNQRGAFAKTIRSRARGKLAKTGRLIGESLGTMWEIGTTKMAPRPWFRPAVARARELIARRVAAGYEQIFKDVRG